MKNHKSTQRVIFILLTKYEDSIYRLFLKEENRFSKDKGTSITNIYSTCFISEDPKTLCIGTIITNDPGKENKYISSLDLKYGLFADRTMDSVMNIKI